MDDLGWLGSWYRQQCDGDWEHEFGVAIDTLDNPGWSVRIDLTGTPLSDVPFAEEEVDEGERWYRLWREDAGGRVAFNGVGAPETLPLIIARFRRWATA